MEVWSSQEVLSQPVAGNHFVQLYQDRQSLAEVVCHYITHPSDHEEAAIVIARGAHIQDLDAELARQGVSMAKLVVHGALWIYDADTMLAQSCQDGKPDSGAFLRSVGAIFSQVLRRHQSVRVYGEMVDILWQRGEHAAALQMEEFWNTLLKDLPFSLLCAYAVDNLDARNYDGALQGLCRCHSHLLPPQPAQVLEQAMTELHHQAAHLLQQAVFSTSTLGHPTTLMPAAQAALLSLSQSQPAQLAPLLQRLRSHLTAPMLAADAA